MGIAIPKPEPRPCIIQIPDGRWLKGEYVEHSQDPDTRIVRVWNIPNDLWERMTASQTPLERLFSAREVMLYVPKHECIDITDAREA